MPILWYMISEECRAKLRSLLPDDWLPPRQDGSRIGIIAKLEDIEEIDKIMRQPPHDRRGEDE